MFWNKENLSNNRTNNRLTVLTQSQDNHGRVLNTVSQTADLFGTQGYDCLTDIDFLALWMR